MGHLSHGQAHCQACTVHTVDEREDVLIGFWLVVFNIPSTARSFRDGTPFTVPCEGREAP